MASRVAITPSPSRRNRHSSATVQTKPISGTGVVVRAQASAFLPDGGHVAPSGMVGGAPMRWGLHTRVSPRALPSYTGAGLAPDLSRLVADKKSP
jgi:hypothetical protein